MKSVGIVRQVDTLGRIVLPVELRKKFGIEIKDAMEIYTEDDCIILKKYEPSCISAAMQKMYSSSAAKMYARTAPRRLWDI